VLEGLSLIVEHRNIQASIQNLPGFSEEDLLDIYQDLLALPSTGDAQESVSHHEVSQAEDDQTMVLAVDHRLLNAAPDMDSSLSPMATAMRHRRTQDLIQAQNIEQIASTESAEHDTILHHDQPYQRIISRLQTIIVRLNAVRSIVSSGINEAGTQGNVSIGILTIREWLSLVRICVRRSRSVCAHSLLTKLLSDTRAGRQRSGTGS